MARKKLDIDTLRDKIVAELSTLAFMPLTDIGQDNGMKIPDKLKALDMLSCQISGKMERERDEWRVSLERYALENNPYSGLTVEELRRLAWSDQPFD